MGMLVSYYSCNYILVKKYDLRLQSNYICCQKCVDSVGIQQILSFIEVDIQVRRTVGARDVVVVHLVMVRNAESVWNLQNTECVLRTHS